MYLLFTYEMKELQRNLMKQQAYPIVIPCYLYLSRRSLYKAESCLYESCRHQRAEVYSLTGVNWQIVVFAVVGLLRRLSCLSASFLLFYVYVYEYTFQAENLLLLSAFHYLLSKWSSTFLSDNLPISMNQSTCFLEYIYRYLLLVKAG